MSRQKELHYFLDAPWGAWKFGQAWYEQQFEDGRTFPVRGESSPGYSIESHTPGVAQKMAQLLPDAKLIYMLRDPLKRAQSHYTEELYNKHIPSDLSFQQILEAGPDEPGLVGQNYQTMVWTSLYHRQLQCYLEYYALAQFHFVTVEEMKRDLLGTLQGIWRFLGVDDSFVPANLNQKLNERAGKRLRVLNPTALVRHLPGYEHLTAALPQTVKNQYRRLISRQLDQESLMHINAAEEEKLNVLFARDIDSLRHVTGRSFDEWNRNALEGSSGKAD